MDLKTIIGLIVQKDRIDEMAEDLQEALPKMPTAQREEFINHMESLAYTFTTDEAKHIVQKMTPYGEHWSMDKVRAYLEDKGVKHGHCLHYYLIMNMVYNDYMPTAQAFGLKDNTDFFYSLAHDFIDDPDGVKFKVEKYFKM